MPTKFLSVPFYAQNDNDRWYSDGAPGNTQCNCTSHAMLLNYLVQDFDDRSSKNGFSEPESYLQSKLQASGCGRGDHDCFSKCLKDHFGIVSQWRYDLNKQSVMKSIDAGIPLVIGVEYKSSGHIVIITGYDNDGVLINDPYGIRAGADSYYAVVNPGYGDARGKNDRYSWALLDRVWSNGSEGWGRIVKSINGKPTGL